MDWPIALQIEKGRPCPRVDLDPSLALEAELLGWLMHGDAVQRGWTAVMDAMSAAYQLSGGERLTLLRRVKATLSHEDVVMRLHPEQAERPDA